MGKSPQRGGKKNCKRKRGGVKERSAIVLGTMFSGLETPSAALTQSRLAHRLAFAIEKEESLSNYITKVWKPTEIHGDVSDVDFALLPYCDLLVLGAPCQPFARGGLHGGLDDPRGHLTTSIIDFVNARAHKGKELPKAIVMEQSKTLLIKYESIYKNIKKALQGFQYKVKSKVLNTYDHGLPQSRERAYIVAYKPHGDRRFHFPKPLTKHVPLKFILKRKNAQHNSVDITSTTHKLAVAQAFTMHVVHMCMSHFHT